VEIAWSDVALGAAVTAALFTVGKLAIGLYIGGQNLESAFGAAASIAVLLIWVYYSAQIVFLGAEFTQVYARRFGSHAADVVEKPGPTIVGPLPQSPADMVGPAITFGLTLADVWQKRRRAKFHQGTCDEPVSIQRVRPQQDSVMAAKSMLDFSEPKNTRARPLK
jgi:hypothetical protein